MICNDKDVMTMNPEKKFYQQVWEILQDIKEEMLSTRTGKPLKLRNPNIVGSGIIPKDRRENIMGKLEEWGALSIRENPFEPPSSSEYYFYLDIHHDTFETVYSKYQKACDVQSYINKYQEQLYKGIDTPLEFQEVELDKFETKKPVDAPHNSAQRKKKNKLENNWSFDSETNSLCISGKTMEFRSDTNRSELFKLLSKSKKNSSQEWQSVEVFEVLNGTSNTDFKKIKRKMYYLCRDINSDIASKLGKQNFFIYTMTTLKVNPLFSLSNW